MNMIQKSEAIKGMHSFTYMGFNNIATRAKEVKEIIVRITKLMNDAADYRIAIQIYGYDG